MKLQKRLLLKTYSDKNVDLPWPLLRQDDIYTLTCLMLEYVTSA